MEKTTNNIRGRLNMVRNAGFMPGLGMFIDTGELSGSIHVPASAIAPNPVATTAAKTKKTASSSFSTWFSETSLGKWVATKKVEYAKASAKRETENKLDSLRKSYFNLQDKYFKLQDKPSNPGEVGEEINRTELHDNMKAKMKSFVQVLAIKLDLQYGVGDDRGEEKTKALVDELKKLSSDKRFSGERSQAMIAKILSYLAKKDRPDLIDTSKLVEIGLADEGIVKLVLKVNQAKARVIKADKKRISDGAAQITEHLRAIGNKDAGNLSSRISELGARISATAGSKYAGKAFEAIRDMNIEVRKALGGSCSKKIIYSLFKTLHTYNPSPAVLRSLEEQLEDLDMQLVQKINLKKVSAGELTAFCKRELAFTGTIDGLLAGAIKDRVKKAKAEKKQQYEALENSLKVADAQVKKLEEQKDKLVAAISAKEKIKDFEEVYFTIVSQIKANCEAAALRAQQSANRYWFNPLRWVGY
jgi:hypothetical protein